MQVGPAGGLVWRWIIINFVVGSWLEYEYMIYKSRDILNLIPIWIQRFYFIWLIFILDIDIDAQKMWKSLCFSRFHQQQRWPSQEWRLAFLLYSPSQSQPQSQYQGSWPKKHHRVEFVWIKKEIIFANFLLQRRREERGKRKSFMIGICIYLYSFF